MEFQTYSLCPGYSKYSVSRSSFPVPICYPHCTTSEPLALLEAEVEELREGRPSRESVTGWRLVLCQDAKPGAQEGVVPLPSSRGQETHSL